jgi:hypothetical protein
MLHHIVGMPKKVGRMQEPSKLRSERLVVGIGSNLFSVVRHRVDLAFFLTISFLKSD